VATRAQKTKVGIFIVCSTILMAVGLLALSGYKHEDTISYWAEFDESVLGLSQDGLVEYLGVPVGRVRDIYVDVNNRAHVEMEIYSSKVTLRQGVSARLVLYSIATGTLCISLSGGNGPLLAAGAQIPVEQSLAKAVSSKLENLVTNLNEISAAVLGGLDGLEEGSLTGVVAETQALLTDTRQLVSQADTALTGLRTDAQAGIDDFQAMVKDIQQLTRDARTLVVTAQSKVEQADVAETQQQLLAVLENLRNLSERLTNTVVTVDQVARSAMHEADNVEYGIQNTLQAVNEALDAIAELARYLQQDPSALVRGKGKPQGE